MNNLKMTLMAGGITAFVGCAAAVPPQELRDARSAYNRASIGPPSRVNPKDLHVAKIQLELAEAQFLNDGDSEATRNNSYLALRKTEYAEVVARTMQSDQEKANIVAKMHADQTNSLAHTSSELGRSNNRLQNQGVALASETARRKAAEARAAQAAKDLAAFAQVKQEPRGMVITLSGSVLFFTAKWNLLKTAKIKLNDVANALIKEDPSSKIIVEGHTDSRGTIDSNQILSQRRAASVRDYLITRGIEKDRITAVGFGQTRPIADNKTTEGQSNNRRVEIIVVPSANAE
jgi:outer membrane protein OmpA-like peptidoglycan-associated protein